MTPFLKTAVAALALAGSTTIATAQEVTLRFQHFVSPKSANPTYFMEPWARKVEADSNGRIKVELYPFMQLGGKAPSQYDLIRDGAVDGGWVIPGYQPGRFPRSRGDGTAVHDNKIGGRGLKGRMDLHPEAPDG